MFVKKLHPKSLKIAMENIGTDKYGQKIMSKKGEILIFEIKNLSLSATMILKQEALSAGGDFATPKECILAKENFYDGILIGTSLQLEKIINKCKIQPFGLKILADKIYPYLKKKKYFSNLPNLMVIVNVTPDSFFEDSRHTTKSAIERIYTLLQKGIKLIDIGAASSRPGSDLINSTEEIKRLEEIAKEIYTHNLFNKAIFSIDTYNPQTADFALSRGFKMINDVSGFENPQMTEIAQKYQPYVVLMHTKGTPKTMTKLTNYKNLFEEMDIFFNQKIKMLEDINIKNIILDIGFGFAKNKDQNLSLIKNLDHFSYFGYPLLVGASRKQTIGLLTQRDVANRLAGTLSIHLFALQNGANILRIHDEDEHLDMIKIYEALEKNFDTYSL
ncbi:dihydropteroate synthase [Helicobacter sp. 13S00477-4]|uniref:dihydropteroate synthase n=1 Tax=Helicobacter sp. 13S00477-4 TaxID=1905759 RepID=UPI000BA71492|nr:dihydropteroate synthase [Helicobacter sp. 13S00477-4]PAF52638.1 dihydropteroate synthase [Helicobacter sp. 13S00477-4]